MENRPGSLSSWFRLASQARRQPPPPPQPQVAPALEPRRGVPVRQASLFGRLQEDAVQNQQPARPVTPNPSPPAAAPPPPIMVGQPQPQPPVLPKQADQEPQREPSQTRGTGDNSATFTPLPPRVVAPPSTPKVAVRAPTPPPESVVLIKTIVPETPVQNQTLLVATQPNGIGLNDSIRRDKMKLNSNTQAEAQKVFVPNPHVDTRNISPSSPKKEFKRAAATPINGKKDEDMMRMITMSGHNEGAIMDLSASHRHHYRLHQAKDSGIKSDDGESDGKKEEEEEKKNWFLTAGKKKTLVVALTNSNVQCVNNSILFNASTIQRNPGVHINFAGRGLKNTAASDATSGSVIQSSKSSNMSST